MNNLKSCPFCGGIAKLNAPDYEYYSPCWCKCTRCGAEGPTKSSKLEAEKGWNERVMQSEEYKRGYDAAIRHLDRYNYTYLPKMKKNGIQKKTLTILLKNSSISMQYLQSLDLMKNMNYCIRSEI